MKKYILAFLLLLPAITYGQNAYYDSKFIIDWLKHEPGDRDQEREFEKQVLNKLESYIDKSVLNSVNDSARYTIVDSIVKVILERSTAAIKVSTIEALLSNPRFNFDDFANSHKKDKQTLLDLKSLPGRKTKMYGFVTANLVTIENLNRIRNSSGNITVLLDSPIRISRENNTALIGEFRRIAPETISLYGKTTFPRSLLVELDTLVEGTERIQDSILAELVVRLQEGVVWMNTRIEYYDFLAKKLFKVLTYKTQLDLINANNNHIIVRSDTVRLPELSPTETANAAQERVEARQSQPTAQLANFRMPTQSQMVDALATYIAKRFKQEAIIYMIDRLKANMAIDSFSSVVFPETKKLLQNQSAFAVPTFGSEWRYAISKDYAKMIDHIMESDYVARQVKSFSFDHMHDAWLLARMIEKKYSYVEMVSNYAHIYKDSIHTPLIRTFLTWADVYNEQLFSVAKPHIFNVDGAKVHLLESTRTDYWLSPTKFMTDMSDGQLSLFLAMIKEKYKVNVEADFGIDLKLPLAKQNLQHIQKWMSANLLVLNQFQKNQGRLMSSESGSDLFNGSTYWTFMSDIITSMTDTSVIRTLYGKDVKNLKNIADVNEIYSSFQSRNYPVAVGRLLSVIDDVCKESNGELISGGKGVKPKKHYLEKKNDRQEVARIYNSYFSSATNAEDFQQMRDSFSYHIVQVEGVLGNTANLNVFRQVYDSFKWAGNDKMDAMKEEMEAYRDNIGNPSAKQKMTDAIDFYNSSVERLINKKIARLSRHNGCFCSTLSRTKDFASLLNDVMSAGGNPQALSNVIESHAAPPTSYKVKRFTRATWDIGAYLGVYFGYEALQQGNKNFSASRPVYGFTVPIGLNYTRSRLKPVKNGFAKTPYLHRKKGVKDFSGVSHTISLSIVDIAAPVAFRLMDSTSGELPKDVKWSQLLSPGVHYRYGIRNSPFCFSMGVQYTPQLRKINAGTQANAIRAYVGIVFDMPMFFLGKR